MAVTKPMPMCPMAETCKSMMEKPLSGVSLVIPGIIFIALGVVIATEPRVLVWMVALAFILIGLLLLGMAGFIRKIGTRFRAAS